MERKEKIRTRKILFPAGIFFLLFFVESLIAGSAVLGYFIHTGRDMVNDIEKYTRNYSIPLAEAFANVAELSFGRGSFTGLQALFQEKIKQNIVDEAFFAMADGKLVVHSSKEKHRELGGNIANDEFAYNLDIILAPLNSKSNEARFTEYNIISIRMPFRRGLRNLLKEYIYPSLDKTGWIVTRAVFVRGIPVGTVNFIISKERIYSFLENHIMESARLLLVSLACCFSVSLVISLIVLRRYRRIQKEAFLSSGAHADIRESEDSGAEIRPYILEKPSYSGGRFKAVHDSKIDTSGRIIKTEIEEEPAWAVKTAVDDLTEEDYITVELLAEMEEDKFSVPAKNIHPVPEEKKTVEKETPVFVPVFLGSDSDFSMKTVKDPIPVRKKDVH